MEKPKKKILILVDWFYPGFKAGGPIQSCVNLCTALNDYYDIYVLTTDTDHGETKPYQGIKPDQWNYDADWGIHICYLEKSTLSAKKIRTQINFINANVVYLNHLFSPLFVVYPLWLKYLGKTQSKIIVCPRGALYESALSVKKYKKIPLLFLYKFFGIDKKVTFHATNEREKIAIKHFFRAAQIAIADNLPKTNLQEYKPIEKMVGKLKCIFIARIVPIKNLLFLLEAMKTNTHGFIELTIVGPIEDENYWEACKNAISALPANITINYIGAKKNEELAELIQQHHLFILPTAGENFGHSIFESFLCGRPVLISDQTPWLNLTNAHAGWDLPLSNPDWFSEKIAMLVQMTDEEYNIYTTGAWKLAKDFLENPSLVNNYRALFDAA